MATEGERYLRKARESLASAEADVEAGRFNSAANRAYYACFQAAVSALIQAGVTSSGRSWDHRFVASQFSGRLIRRRKLYSTGLTNALRDNFDARIEADYRPDPIRQRTARQCLGQAVKMVSAVAAKLEEKRLGEIQAEYGEAMNTLEAKTPEQCVDVMRRAILAKYPDVDIEVVRQAERDFTIEIFGDYDDMWEVRDHVSELRGDLLDDHDVWIIILPHNRNELD